MGNSITFNVKQLVSLGQKEVISPSAGLVLEKQVI